MRASLLILTLFGLLFASCAGSAAPPEADRAPTPGVGSPTAIEPADQAPTPGSLPADQAPSPSEPADRAPTPGSPTRPDLPFTQYTLSAVLDYDRRHLAVEEQIAYTNHSGEALPDLLLLVEPNRYPGGFSLAAITWEEGQPVANYNLAGAQLRLPLEEPLLPGERIGLSLSFELVLPNQQAPYGYTERQANLGDWYPYLPPYIPGAGWLAREDAYYGEHLAYEMADFQVTLRLASPATASGEPLTIAASARPEMKGDQYLYRLEEARNFAWTVSHLYQVQEAQAGDITVTAYSFPNHPAADGPALETTVAALGVFGDTFSPYPHDSLSVVEADFLDGMEYDGLFFLSHAFYDYYTGDERSNLVIIAAHETAHQWWYGRVGNDQALEPWLDEALSTYSELIFYEKVYPDLAGWWQENRINFHNPEGWVDETIYQASGFYPYRNAVYLRGAMFLGEVRTLLGDEVFFAFLRDYLARYTYRQATTEDFFALLSEYTSEDLSGIVDRYFANR